MGKLSITNPPRLPLRPFSVVLCLVLLIAIHALAQTSATAVPLLLPSAIAFDPQGNLYLAETANHVIRKVDTTGHITTLAGTGTQGFSGDSSPATAAQLDSPQGLALDTANHLYLADTHNHRIRRIDLTTGIITTIAGTGTPSFSGDSSLATTATLNLPTALAIDALGNLYLADTANHRIRSIDAATGIITTLAGTGTQGFSGDGAPATQAAIDSPTSLALDPLNHLYLADTHNHRVRRIDLTTGIITTLAGTDTPGFSGDGAPSTASTLNLPTGLTLDPLGNLYFADTQNHRIRRIDAITGVITTVAGTGTQAYTTGTATTASLDSPHAAIISPTGLLTFADTGNQRIRQRAPDNTLLTVAGLGVTLPGTLTLAAPSVISYGTVTLTATLTSSTPATGLVTFLDRWTATTSPNAATITLGTAPLASNTASLSTAALPAGTHSITATYAGDLSHASAQSPTATLTITPATTSTNASTPTPATPVTLSAQVATTTSGTPTGSITFLDANNPLATTPINSTGTASLTTATLSSGPHTLTARYSGDPNFLASTSTPTLLTIGTSPTADFTLTTTGNTSQTILSGASANFTFTTQLQGGTLTSPIALAASGLPPGATASFHPAYLPPGTTSTTFTLTIATLKTAATQSTARRIIPYTGTLALLLLPVFLTRRRRPRSNLALLAIPLAIISTSLTLGCGDRINATAQSATQPHTYTITVTGTATTPTGTTLQHTANVTLQIQ
jgi:sugar lactone lactonase YvrE